MGVCGSKPQHQETGEQVIGGDPEPAFPVGKAPVEAPVFETSLFPCILFKNIMAV
jgi:hypothetical protein